MKTIICEDEAHKNFIEQLIVDLKNNGLIENNINPNQYTIKFENKQNILNINSQQHKNFQPQLPKQEKILILMDCDFKKDDKKCGGCKNSIKCLKEVIDYLNKYDIQTDYFLFDNNLEKFILDSLDEKNKKCFNDLKRCLNLKEKSKHQKSLICAYKGLYPNKPYDFSHKNFDKIKQKLINLFKKD